MLTDDVARWSHGFLNALADVDAGRWSAACRRLLPAGRARGHGVSGPDGLDDALAGLAATARGGAPVLVALDFDGVLAPLVDVPSQSRATPDGVAALRRLGALEHIHLALVSGRGLADLASVAQVPDGTMLVGSHGAEVGAWDGGLRRGEQVLDEAQADLLAELSGRLRALVDGTAARVEVKPTTAVLHTRGVDPGRRRG